MSDCKESFVQCQNGEFNEGDTTGVDEGVGESELSGVNACTWYRAEVLCILTWK